MGERALSEIFVVDDDRAVREMLSLVLGGAGYKVVCFADGAALLAVARVRIPACMLLDVNIPSQSGFGILKELRALDYPAPIVMVSGSGNISMAVDAIRSGAFDFIEKPFQGSEIVDRIEGAIGAFSGRCDRSSSKPLSLHFPGREPLTRREREVLELISVGSSNKNAGRELGISSRTIEDHRANIMKKLGTRNATELLRLVLDTERT
jgi:FixJ family two-component response regulator